MISHYHVNDDLSKAKSIDSNLDRFIINYFYELIDDDKDWVITVSFSVYWDWQTYDKIYQYIFSAIDRNW